MYLDPVLCTGNNFRDHPVHATVVEGLDCGFCRQVLRLRPCQIFLQGKNSDLHFFGVQSTNAGWLTRNYVPGLGLFVHAL